MKILAKYLSEYDETKINDIFIYLNSEEKKYKNYKNIKKEEKMKEEEISYSSFNL